MDNIFAFPAEVATIMAELQTAREVLRICAPEGPLDGALEKLCAELRRAIRRRSSVLRTWSVVIPKPIERSPSLTLAPDDGWKFGDECIGVFFYCSNPTDPDRTADDPYVSVLVPEGIPEAEALRVELRRQIPDGFTDDYPQGDADEADAFWKYIRFADKTFVKPEGYDAEAYLGAVLRAMEQAAAVRPIIDDFLWRRAVKMKRIKGGR
jgi:hypothetical protein